jgi:hypothetical protein
VSCACCGGSEFVIEKLPVILVGPITLHLTAVLTRHFLNRHRTAVRRMLG